MKVVKNYDIIVCCWNGIWFVYDYDCKNAVYRPCIGK